MVGTNDKLAFMDTEEIYSDWCGYYCKKRKAKAKKVAAARAYALKVAENKATREKERRAEIRAEEAAEENIRFAKEKAETDRQNALKDMQMRIKMAELQRASMPIPTPNNQPRPQAFAATNPNKDANNKDGKKDNKNMYFIGGGVFLVLIMGFMFMMKK